MADQNLTQDAAEVQAVFDEKELSNVGEATLADAADLDSAAPLNGMIAYSAGTSNIPNVGAGIVITTQRTTSSDDVQEGQLAFDIDGYLYHRELNATVWTAWRQLGALAQASTWSALQTFSAGLTVSAGTLTAQALAATNATLSDTLILTNGGSTGGAGSIHQAANVLTLQAGTSGLNIDDDTGGATHLDIDASGNLTVSVGNFVVGTSGKGLDFSITSDTGGMTSELLDDYEEGTWTVLPADATSGGNTATPAAEAGFYTKIGRSVLLNLSVTDIDTTGMTGGNDFFLQGLPFANIGTIVTVGSVSAASITFGGSIHLRLVNSASAVGIGESVSGATIDLVTVSQIADDQGDVVGQIGYIV